MTDVRLEGSDGKSHAIGCEKGCGAIIDTGTSLTGVPSDVYRIAAEAIQSLDPDCSNLASLPDLRFKLDGIEFSLPPEAYIGEIVGEIPKDYQKFFKHRSLNEW